MPELLEIEQLFKYANSQNAYITFALHANREHAFAYSANLTYDLTTNKELLSLLAKLRDKEKPVIWSINLSAAFKLKQQIWFKCLDKIANSDIIRINYYSEVYDDFVILIDIIRRYNISNIYIKFYDQISMDIVQFVSNATKANTYYNANIHFVSLDEFIKFEDC